jgi:hypothetical protein
MLPYMITRLSAYYDEKGNHRVNVTTGGFGLTTEASYGDQQCVTGLLNSRLLDWFLKKVRVGSTGKCNGLRQCSSRGAVA